VAITVDGKVTDGFEELNSVYNRLKSPDGSMWQEAVAILAGHVARGDASAQDAVLSSLHDDDFNV